MARAARPARPGTPAQRPGTPQGSWEPAVRHRARAVLARAWVVREVGELPLPTRLPRGAPPPTFQRSPMLLSHPIPRLCSGQLRLLRTARPRPSEVGRKATGIIAQTKTACSRVATLAHRRMLARHFSSAERCAGLEAWRPTRPSRSPCRRNPHSTRRAALPTATSG